MQSPCVDHWIKFYNTNIKNALVKGCWKKAKEIKKLWKHIRLVRLLIDRWSITEYCEETL